MKNLRVSKKNPSKILKIIDVPSNRYVSQRQYSPNSSHLHQLVISSSREPKGSKVQHFPIHKQKIPSSPSRSQRLIEFSSLQRAKKIKSKTLNRSQQMIKSEEKDSARIVIKQSIEGRSKYEQSPYIRRTRYKNSEQFLNFNSVSLGERQHRQSKDLKDIFRNTSRKRHTLLRLESHEDTESDKKTQDEVIESAKRLLNSGQYRKCLLVAKSILQNKPNHPQALYLSAISWYNLEDRQKTHQLTEQLIRSNPTYSPELYKIKAVCYFKSLEYSKSLMNLKHCHELFSDEPESYELEGKILMKMKRWKQAINSYQRVFELTSNLQALGMMAFCHEELQQSELALECYSQIARQKNCPIRYILRKMKLHNKLQQFGQVLQTMEIMGDMQKSLKTSRQKDQIYYICSYANYKLKKYSDALILIDEGLRLCEHQGCVTKLNQLLLVIKIIERDIYEAHHLIDRLEDEPELRVMRRFVEGVSNLMRRNFNDGIVVLLSIQQDLGFKLELGSSYSNHSEFSVRDGSLKVEDQFLIQIRKTYLLFLSYGYMTIGEFHSAFKLIELQHQLGIPPYFQLGLSYNREICLGILGHCDRDFRQAMSHFIKAKALYQNKLEPPFSLAINYLQMMLTQQSEVGKLQMVQEAKGQFDICKRIIGRTPSNTAASVFYFNCLLHGYLEEWKEALVCIDQSIERSEDHYWRYFYIRGMLLACVHSFKQAINDITISINLSGNSKPQCYLLRSKCLQIEGDGNEAFRDLQQYISLKPDDPEVHKYAGQLLFQNGAFQDSVTAFTHQPIPQTIQNFDIYLTEGKSYFLLGKFTQAINSFKKAYSTQPSDQISFDMKVFDFLDKLITQADPQVSRKRLDEIYTNFEIVGKIFKVSDFYLLRATCLILEKQFQEAIETFNISMKQKMGEVTGDNEDEAGLHQNSKQIQSFNNQIQYNIILCQLNLENGAQAKKLVQKMKIDLDQPFYSDFVLFRKWISREVQIYKKQEVFPNRNKLSNFLPKISIRGKDKQFHTQLKLCIPFPKVEPPEIFPSFDKTLLQRLSVLNVERKPQAPWILRETNSIKFTQKMEVFSRLQLEDSQSESASTFQMFSVDKSHLGQSSHHSQRLKTTSQKISSRSKLLELIERPL